MADRVERIHQHVTAPPLVNKFLTAKQYPVAFSAGDAVVVAVTGATSPIAYSMLPLIARGDLIATCNVHLRLLAAPSRQEALDGVRMELEDCAFPNLLSVTVTDRAEFAFTDADVAFLLDEPTAEYSKESAIEEYRCYGRALSQSAKKNVKVCVVATDEQDDSRMDSNTLALVTSLSAPGIARTNVTCSIGAVRSQWARSEIARVCGVDVSTVSHVGVWGDGRDACVVGSDTHIASASDARTLIGPDWCAQHLHSRSKRKRSGVMACACAAVRHMHYWLGPERSFHYMAVPSDGSYGVSAGVLFSLPVSSSNGCYTVTRGLTLYPEISQSISASLKRLRQTKKQHNIVNT